MRGGRRICVVLSRPAAADCFAATNRRGRLTDTEYPTDRQQVLDSQPTDSSSPLTGVLPRIPVENAE